MYPASATERTHPGLRISYVPIRTPKPAQASALLPSKPSPSHSVPALSDYQC